jgi:hypothetical protein
MLAGGLAVHIGSGAATHVLGYRSPLGILVVAAGVAGAATWVVAVRRLTRRRPPLRPPENVRIIYPDGQVVPVECVYQGWDTTEGVHEWVAVCPVRLEWGMRVCYDVLPARTSVTVAARP